MHGHVRIIVTAVVVVLAPGCSDGRLSKTEYIEQADSICAETAAASADLEAPTDARSFDRLVERAQELTDDALSRLRALEPPEEDEAQIDRMLDAIERAAAELPAIADAARAQDAAEMGRIGNRIQSLAQTAQTIASDYGFAECGKTSVPGAE